VATIKREWQTTGLRALFHNGDGRSAMSTGWRHIPCLCLRACNV